MRILVSLWPGLGDIMFATPALRHLRRRHPSAWITAALFDGGPGRELLETNPHLDEVLVAPRGTIYSPAGIRKWSRLIRAARYDIGIELSFPVLWFFRLCGIPRRVRFGKRALWWLVPYRDRRDRDLHASEHFLKAVEQLDGAVERDDRGYDLFLTAEDGAFAKSAVAALPPGTRIAVHTGARCNRNKRWELARFAELCGRLIVEFQARILVVGGSDDVAAGNFLVRRLTAAAGVRGPQPPVALNLAGRLTLRETAAVARECRLYVGNDSGPLHVVSTAGTPIVAIFASSNPANFHPLAAVYRVVQPEASCVGCFRFPGYLWLPWGLRLRWHNQCRAMDRLEVDQVLAACRDLLSAGQPAAAACAGPG